MIESAWKIENGMMRLRVTIPANMQAVITIPGTVVDQVKEDGLPLSTDKILPKQGSDGCQLTLEKLNIAYLPASYMPVYHFSQ